MLVTFKLSVKVLKKSGKNPANAVEPVESGYFFSGLKSGSGQNDPNIVRFRFGQNFRSGRTPKLISYHLFLKIHNISSMGPLLVGHLFLCIAMA